MDLMDMYAERNKFRSLPIHEQLSIIEEQSNESNAIIGEIYFSSIFLELNDRKRNSKILADLLGNASLVEDYGIMGMGDVEFRWIFTIRNLFIGICGTAYRGGPLLVGGSYKVYRLDEEQKNAIDIDKITFALFGY